MKDQERLDDFVRAICVGGLVAALVVTPVIGGGLVYLQKCGYLPTKEEIGIDLNSVVTKGPNKGKTVQRVCYEKVGDII